MEGGEAFALVCPLITKADGGKFGKTESGNVWLDRRYTSPYKFYQFWLNVSDTDAEKYIKIFTALSKEEIEALVAEQQSAPHLRPLQKKLAEEITVMFTHGKITPWPWMLRRFSLEIHLTGTACHRRGNIPAGI